jgi:hypothetical protein
MRLAVACCSASITLALSGCSSTNVSEPPSELGGLPLNVGNGIGSQYGNYAMVPDGETLGPSGQRCFIFNWDRPLNKDFAIRYTSASCESKEHPEWVPLREVRSSPPSALSAFVRREPIR